MKKLITLSLILIVAIGARAQQIKYIDPTTKDTVFTNFTVTVAPPVPVVSATTVIHHFKAPTTPPVTPPVTPPITPPGNVPVISIANLVDGVMPDPITQPSYNASGAINVTGVSGKKYSNLLIDMKGSSTSPIRLTNCTNDTIVFCSLKNSTSPAVYLYNCKGIVVMYDYFSNVSTGVYEENCTNAGTMIIALNQFRNMIGPMPRGQFVQFNTTTNCTGCVIGWNRGENFAGASHPEDTFNLYMSSGTASTPIQITTNWERGGGPSTTGSGGMLGDNGGSYQILKYNISVNPGNCGMAIAGGTNNTISNNQIYSAILPFSQNGGIYVWDNNTQYHISNAIVSNNKVTWYRPDGSLDGFWFAIPITDTGNNWNANLNTSILPANILTWQ